MKVRNLLVSTLLLSCSLRGGFSADGGGPFPLEDGGREVTRTRVEFRNWGGTVANKPAYTFFPKTKTGVRNIVTWARAQKPPMKVRAGGYRHTWSDLYSDDAQVFVSLRSQREVEPPAIPPPPLDGQLQSIELVREIEEGGQPKHLCKIGAATTNEQFRQWCVGRFGHYPENSWTLPLNVIMVEITFGGSNAPICHGAGWKNKTLSDLVTEIEFVNPLGEFQTVTDPKLIKTASGCFGLLGIVTSLTLKLDPMTHARMVPTKPRLALGVPPPDDFRWPDDSMREKFMSGVSERERKEAQRCFTARCAGHHYSEWFWFSLHDKCWVNTWHNDGEQRKSREYPNWLEAWAQEKSESLVREAVRFFSSVSSDPSYVEEGTRTLSGLAMWSLPAESEIVTHLINALHFRRGIHNMPCQDMEFQIPIPSLASDPTAPDWSICQRAWWDAVVTVEEFRRRRRIPMRLPLEMRIMDGSDVTMAPQHGNRLGTCSIEILTLEAGTVEREEWLEFMQAVVDKWSAYTDFEGRSIRPHWAKQWEGLRVRGKDIIRYLKEDAYRDDLPVFRRHLEEIVTRPEGGRTPYTLNDLKMFSNPLLHKIFSDTLWGGEAYVAPPPPPPPAGASAAGSMAADTASSSGPALLEGDPELLSAELVFKMQQLYDANQIRLKEELIRAQREIWQLRKDVGLVRPRAAVAAAAASRVEAELLPEADFKRSLAKSISETQKLCESIQTRLIGELGLLRGQLEEERAPAAAAAAASGAAESGEIGRRVHLSAPFWLVVETQRLFESGQNSLEEELSKSQKEIEELRGQLRSGD